MDEQRVVKSQGKRQRIVSKKPKIPRPRSQNIHQTSFEPRDKIMEQAEQLIDDQVNIQLDNGEQHSQQNGGSDKKLTGGQREEVQTTVPPFNLAGDLSGLKTPYEFLEQRGAPCYTFILPHFTWKSINFWMSATMLIMFVSLLIAYASKESSPLAWSCLLFKTQNKFYPRLRYNYQLWRVLVSSLFHGNISHIVLNLIGLQVYGYFAEWYYGRWRYVLTIVLAMINSHLLSCLTNAVSVSSCASGILYSILGLKILFFIKYRGYKPLQNRRIPIYGLFGLIFVMNLVVLFVGSNVDVGGHIGGIVTGLFCGSVFYFDDVDTTQKKAFKYGFVALNACFVISLLAGCFALNSQFNKELNSAIDLLC